jgi:hypothetical protein
MNRITFLIPNGFTELTTRISGISLFHYYHLNVEINSTQRNVIRIWDIIRNAERFPVHVCAEYWILWVMLYFKFIQYAYVKT